MDRETFKPQSLLTVWVHPDTQKTLLEAGMQPVGVTYGFGSLEELQGAGALEIAATPACLPGAARRVIG